MPYQSLLSQDEVDALLAGVTGENSEAPAQVADAAPDGVRAYDLSSPDRIVRQRMQTLELINERFARRMRTMFFSFMRRNADITVNAIKIQKYMDFERNLPVPSNLNIVTLQPLRGSGLFTFDPNLVFLVVDSLFGGNGRYNTRIEGRDFTSTEQRIIQRLVHETLACYTEAWKPAYDIDAQYVRSEMQTKFANICGSSDVVVVCGFNIELGATGGRLNVCLPYSMLEPIRDVLMRPLQQNATDAIDQRWSQQLSREVRSAEVELVAEFARIDTTVAKLLHLNVGDVLPIDVSPATIASVGGVPVLECGYGTFNGHHALRVNKLLASAGDSDQLLAHKSK